MRETKKEYNKTIYALQYEELEMHGVGKICGAGIYQDYYSMGEHYFTTIALFDNLEDAQREFDKIGERKERGEKGRIIEKWDKDYEAEHKIWFVDAYRLEELHVKSLGILEKHLNRTPRELIEEGTAYIDDYWLWKQQEESGYDYNLIDEKLCMNADIKEYIEEEEE